LPYFENRTQPMNRGSAHKPDRPKNFPLFPHANGQWARKIKKRIFYFGVWADRDKALENYLRDKDALYAGRNPSEFSAAGLAVGDGCNLFLMAKKSLLESRDIAQVTFKDYEDTCKGIVESIGRTRAVATLVAADFDKLRLQLAKRLGPVALGNEINRVRIVFRYLYEASLIDSPVRFGPQFRRPPAKALRLAKAESGSKLLTQDELNTLLDKANSRLKAMIYLGINCGMGNADIGNLNHSHLDLANGWLCYPRPKTGIMRKAKLWRETITALRNVPRIEPSNPVHVVRVFLTHSGNPWSTDSSDNPVAKEFTKLVKAAHLERPGLTFYALRHTFQTIAEECRDAPAVRFIMGHAPVGGDMSSVYREKISDERLVDVAVHVRKWLTQAKKVSRRVS
jgi:integrase